MIKNIKVLFTLMLMSFASKAQVLTDTIYKSGKWWHINMENLYKDNTQSDTTDYSIHEKVEILKSDNVFKVAIGNKMLEYKIISEKRITDSEIPFVQYQTLLNNQAKELTFTDMRDGSFYVNINWEIGACIAPGSIRTVADNTRKQRNN